MASRPTTVQLAGVAAQAGAQSAPLFSRCRQRDRLQAVVGAVVDVDGRPRER